MHRNLHIAAACAVLLGVATLAWLRWDNPGTSRPLEIDEWITVKYYTWMGLKSSGEGNRLVRAAQLPEQPAPDLKLLGMGIYRSLGVWKEPNNHVVNSFLLNFTLASTTPCEASIRIVSFVGALAFAAAMYWFCAGVLGWSWGGIAAAICGFSFPYVVQQSLTARGYTWMLTLQVLLLGLLWCSARRPTSVWLGLLCACVAVLNIVNLVNMAVYWVLPAYLTAWLYPPCPAQKELGDDTRRVWRKNLLIQLLGIGGVVLVFAIDRLPYVVSSAGQYGIRFENRSELVGHFSYILAYLFPNASAVAAALFGLAGLSLLLLPTGPAFLRCLLPVVLVAGLGFTLATKKLGYERNYGYLIPLVLLGIGWAIERMRHISAKALMQLPAGVAAVAVTAAVVRDSLAYSPPEDARIAVVQELARSTSTQSANRPSYLVLPRISGTLERYAPGNWHTSTDILAKDDFLDLYVFVQRINGWSLEMEEGRSQTSAWQTICDLSHADVEGACKVLKFPLRKRPWGRQSKSTEGISFCVWYPDPDRVGIDSSKPMAYLETSGTRYLSRQIRANAKLDFYSRLHAIEFICHSAVDYNRLVEILDRGVEQYGGSVVCFSSTDTLTRRP